MHALIKKVGLLRQEFAESYSGNAHIQEFLPKNRSEQMPLSDEHILPLHQFARKNPIYHNHFDDTVSDVSCTIYEGDINDYWLDSIKHGSSCQPFYPTWIISAYLMTGLACELGYNELVDIGSGDGRIAYCGGLFGLQTHSIEIDGHLVDLQNTICKSTGRNFNPVCADAMEFDYQKLNLTHPVFFIGGLPQMGGDILAASIIERIQSIPNLAENAGIVFAGSNSKRDLSANIENGGWGTLIKKYDLQVTDTVSLPTAWTFDQKVQTPYIYTKFS